MGYILRNLFFFLINYYYYYFFTVFELGDMRNLISQLDLSI